MERTKKSNTTWYVYNVDESGKYTRDFKTTNIQAVRNTFLYSKLCHGIDSTYRIAIVRYTDGKRIGEWRNFKD